MAIRGFELAVRVIQWWHDDDRNFGKEEPDFIQLAREFPGAREEAIRLDEARPSEDRVGLREQESR